MQVAIAKVGDMSVANLGEKIDQAMEIYHAGDSGGKNKGRQGIPHWKTGGSKYNCISCRTA